MINRRGFIKSTFASGMAGYALPVFGRPDGRKYKTALVGTGWWGMNILGEAMACGQCEVVAMCDVDTRQMHPAAETREQADRRRAEEVQRLSRAAGSGKAGDLHRRHARPLASAGHDRRGEGGRACVRGKADRPHHHAKAARW